MARVRTHSENLENTGILYLQFAAVNILEFRQRSWKILEYEPIFWCDLSALFIFVMPINYCHCNVCFIIILIH